MSWQLAAFSVLGLSLAAGFAWYERTRPDARIVALVGTLAAFAALGRIAFAAVPNVKPTSDIVLISGYALGGAPGFVVGAVAGLTSNFFFGQGPWTPWQMAAWGATGIAGAGLARLTGRHLGRWPLAFVCFVLGFAFTATQDFGDWVTYSDHSLAQLGIYVGKGIGFDFVHAAGCLVFALAFGPALARSIQRFTLRLQVRWEAPVVPVLLVGVALAAGAGLVRAPSASAAPPASYLLSAQNSDGGFGPAPGQPSSALYSGWAALGLASEGISPAGVSQGGASLLSYVLANVGGTDPGSVERTILAVRAAGVTPSSGLVGELRRDIGPDGSISNQANWTAFGVLALRAAGAAAPSSTVGWLLRQQDSDGGFGFGTAGGASDVDDTGAVLEALDGDAPRTDARAVRFIRGQQDRDGGFPTQGASGSNAQSTAWAVQGLIAAGINPASVHRPGGANPAQYLNSLIASSGAIDYSRGDAQTPVWVTAEVMMALAGKPLPLEPAPPTPRSATPHAAPSTQAHRAAAASKVAKPTGRKRAVARRRTPTGHVSVPLAQLAGDIGIVTGLALAPLGVGQIQ